MTDTAPRIGDVLGLYDIPAFDPDGVTPPLSHNLPLLEAMLGGDTVPT